MGRGYSTGTEFGLNNFSVKKNKNKNKNKKQKKETHIGKTLVQTRNKKGKQRLLHTQRISSNGELLKFLAYK